MHIRHLLRHRRKLAATATAAVGAFRERAGADHGLMNPLAPVGQWIGELPDEDQRCLLFAAAEGLGTGTRWNALAECLGAGASGCRSSSAVSG